MKNNENLNEESEVFIINGIKFDYYDIDLALHCVSSEIVNYQKLIQAGYSHKNPQYNGLLHSLEEKLKLILKNMKCPPEEEIRPAGNEIKSNIY